MIDRHTIPVFDGHNDVLLQLYRAGREKESSFFKRNRTGHIDMPRAIEGGFGGGFFAVFVPNDPNNPLATMPDGLPPALDLAYSQQFAINTSAVLFRLEAASKGRFKVVRTVDELSANLASDVVSAILHFEGAEPIDPSLDALEVFYQAGLRSLGLVWSRPNEFAHGVPFNFPCTPDTGPGLTDAGKELVRACNRLGILVDLSHLNEKGFWDVARISDAPLVATHSNVYNLCNFTRNLTDKQLDAIAESDGMVGVNFGVYFLREDGGRDVDTPLETIVRHVDYLVERLGIDRVGFGSDFDGASVPEEIADVAGLPRLLDALRKSGYDEPSLRKLAHENWVRVLRKTWQG
ncbi:MAG: rane dipeptidase [Chloroflexia bacterium]|jgi:membrane dipeptidase|nr:rane dipeptidase [Chloroflexia bacterium]